MQHGFGMEETMNARRAQDILRHIINDEDYGAAILDKITVAESVYVIQHMLPTCLKKAQETDNINDSGFFSAMIEKYRPIVIEKLKKAEHLWVLYSDTTGYPYMVDGDMFIFYDYAHHADMEQKLNAAGYKVALQPIAPELLQNELAHMYRNGYDRIRFTDGTGEPFVVEKEEVYPFENFFKEDYMMNPGLQRAMIAFFQEFRKDTAMDANREQIVKTREDKMIKAIINGEYMVPCIKEETEEAVEISHPFIDLTESIKDREEGEKVIAVPVFTDGFELDKCYEGHHENMLYQYDELVNLVEELGASGVIINCLGESYYMNHEIMNKVQGM